MLTISLSIHSPRIPCFQIFREIKVSGFDSNLFETKQIFYKSKDGTEIPMFIVKKKVGLYM